MSQSAKNKIYIHSGFTVGAASPGRSQETCGFYSMVYTKLGGFLNLKWTKIKIKSKLDYLILRFFWSGCGMMFKGFDTGMQINHWSNVNSPSEYLA